MNSHLNNIYKARNSNDFQRRLFNNESKEMFIFRISPDNHFHILFLSQSIYKAFEFPEKIISNSILPLFHNRIYKADQYNILRQFVKLRTKSERTKIEFKCLLPIKGLCVCKISIKTTLDNQGECTFFITFLEVNKVNILKPINKTDLLNTIQEILFLLNKKKTFYIDSQKSLKPTEELKRNPIMKEKPTNKAYNPSESISPQSEHHSEKEIELHETIKQYREYNNRLLNFSNIVSHNLTTHSGNIKMLLDLIDTEEDVLTKMEIINHLRTVSDDFNETITQISQIVPIQKNSNTIKEPLLLNNYIEKTCKTINLCGIEKKAKITNNVPEGTIVNFNSAYLESILLNLCTNAVKYAHPKRFPNIIFDFFIEGKKKALTITDNGLGIDLNKHGDLLFGLYKTFHNNEDAHGIGLYMTKNQIESMDGQITVNSTPDIGTTFKILFND